VQPVYRSAAVDTVDCHPAVEASSRTGRIRPVREDMDLRHPTSVEIKLSFFGSGLLPQFLVNLLESVGDAQYLVGFHSGFPEGIQVDVFYDNHPLLLQILL